jgi:hypothetical protein
MGWGLAILSAGLFHDAETRTTSTQSNPMKSKKKQSQPPLTTADYTSFRKGPSSLPDVSRGLSFAPPASVSSLET